MKRSMQDEIAALREKYPDLKPLTGAMITETLVLDIRTL